jgi:hypothetical protein
MKGSPSTASKNQYGAAMYAPRDFTNFPRAHDGS